ncbi:hypothetical protein AVEN_181580-1 [Araneus ventricosus]|uniref:Uncharacterized protein n=1 Tax=Araneus ventricosus TaxID=182803 RepID=A0A4Y2E6P9_ARAVE|nr:hypothetical protein AVEN_181580-1 [Araneus ventricosus]
MVSVGLHLGNMMISNNKPDDDDLDLIAGSEDPSLVVKNLNLTRENSCCSLATCRLISDRVTCSSMHIIIPSIIQPNGPYAPLGLESIEKQQWRNKQNDWPISDSEIKAVLSQLFKTDQWLPPAGHVSEDVMSHA